jgi:hypothetical protein
LICECYNAWAVFRHEAESAGAASSIGRKERFRTGDMRTGKGRKMAVCCVVGRGFVVRPCCLVKRSRETKFNETALPRFVNAKMSVDSYVMGSIPST